MNNAIRIVSAVVILIGSFWALNSAFARKPTRKTADAAVSQDRQGPGSSDPSKLADLGWKQLVAGPFFDPTSGMNVYVFSLDDIRTDGEADRVAVCSECDTPQIRAGSKGQEVFVRDVARWYGYPMYVVGIVPAANSGKPASTSTSGVILSPPKIDPVPPRD